eukprot:CAMPEP_0197548332 /NCGR_PEP_ID=MMETSP1320-20131121/2488_1 /TAXON_ID=91990 /ORGANISM="Bolidomonas sp., Strain RCC2347" /LENGTH=278 /DNA_ID=CAMNT_0043108327 /DNA_START=211 /DNA_END=1043 /DNA_ORIENTATION=+
MELSKYKSSHSGDILGEETKKRVVKAHSRAEELVTKSSCGGFMEVCMPEKLMRVRVCRVFSAFTMTAIFLTSMAYFYTSSVDNCPTITVETSDPRCSGEDDWMWAANDYKVASFIPESMHGNSYSCDPSLTAEQIKDNQGDPSFGTAKIRPIIHQSETCPLVFKLKDLTSGTPDFTPLIDAWSADEQSVTTASALKVKADPNYELKIPAGTYESSCDASNPNKKFFVKIDSDFSCDLGYELDEADDTSYFPTSSAAATWMQAGDKGLGLGLGLCKRKT